MGKLLHYIQSSNKQNKAVKTRQSNFDILTMKLLSNNSMLMELGQVPPKRNTTESKLIKLQKHILLQKKKYPLSTNTCLKLTIEALEKGVKKVQS